MRAAVLDALTAAALIFAVAAVLALAAAPIGLWLELWEFPTGFLLLRWAAILGAGGLVLALVTAVAGAVTRHARARGLGILALLLALPAVAVPVALVRKARSLPPINDITTNPADPPAFTAAGEDASGGAAGVPYPGSAFAARQERAYPDLTTIPLEAPPAAVFRAAVDVAREQSGWEVVLADSASGVVEASVTTRWFRFVDDVVVRVRPGTRPGTTDVDVRSRSRVGVGDVGANAERIRRFRAAILRRLAEDR